MGDDLSDVLVVEWHIRWEVGYTLVMNGALNII